MVNDDDDRGAFHARNDCAKRRRENDATPCNSIVIDDDYDDG